jgi:enamine deaminase RidA (YjgF/YER057c/UK114 family)
VSFIVFEEEGLARDFMSSVRADAGRQRTVMRMPSAPAVRPRFLDPDGLLKPPGYSQVVATPAGSLVWVSGQVALDSHDLPGFLEQLRPPLQRLGAGTDTTLPALNNLNSSPSEERID